MIIAYCVICSYVCVIHFLLSINADDDHDDDRSKKRFKSSRGNSVETSFETFQRD